MLSRLLTGWGLATLGVGFLLTVLTAALVKASEDRMLAADLSERGSAHVAALEEIGRAAVLEAEGVAAFFEASESVSSLEFARFTNRSMAAPVSKIEYARVLGDRWQRAPFQNDDSLKGVIVTEMAGRPELGLDLGDDVLSMPDRLSLIEQTAATGEPAVGTFISIDSDDEPGDVLVVTAERDTEGRVWGIVMATIQLDEILEGQLLQSSSDIEWTLLPQGDAAAHSGPTMWRGVIEIYGETLWLQGTRPAPSAGVLFWAVIAGGAVLTAAAAWTLQSVRAQRRAEDEAEALRTAAADKDRFLSGVGHQLRTPLTGVVGMLDLLAEEGDLVSPDERREFLRTAKGESHKLAELVDRFLIAGRLRGDTLTVLEEVVDFHDLLAEALQRVERPSQVDIVVDGHVPECLGDPLRIRQVLHSLIENAARHARTSVGVAVRVEGDYVVVGVSNDGTRLDENEAEKAFNPFTATPEEGQPTRLGIGLWIARELAQRMGGSLQYESAESTTFVLRLRTATRQQGDSASEPTRERSRLISVRSPRPSTDVDPDVVTLVQPIVELRTGSIAGYEALTRGVRGETWWELQAQVPPVTLQTKALTSALAVRESSPPKTFLAINVDSPLVAHPSIRDCFSAAGDLTGLVVELTEHPAVLDDDTIEVLDGIRRAGALIALDDFGAGQNRLARLLAVRPSFVKLDGRLIDRLRDDPGARGVVDTVCDLASRVGASVVAENVERVSQLDVLAEHGVPMAQGFFFGRPAEPWPNLNESAQVSLATASSKTNPPVRTL